MKLGVDSSKVQGGKLLVRVVDKKEKESYKQVGSEEIIEICSQEEIEVSPDEADPKTYLKTQYQNRRQNGRSESGGQNS